MRRIAEGALTYAAQGMTQSGEWPPGYRLVRHRIRVGDGAEAFERLARAVLGWEIQRGSGLRIETDSPTAVPGARIVSGFGLGPFRIKAPCEVVWVEGLSGQPAVRRAGFGYGTLPGHPASGEEAFIAEIDVVGRVFFEVLAYSRPANWIYSVGSPVSKLAQRVVTSRYLECARRLAAVEP